MDNTTDQVRSGQTSGGGGRDAGVRGGTRGWRQEGRVQGAGCRAQGAGCRVQGAGCRVLTRTHSRYQLATQPRLALGAGRTPCRPACLSLPPPQHHLAPGPPWHAAPRERARPHMQGHASQATGMGRWRRRPGVVRCARVQGGHHALLPACAAMRVVVVRPPWLALPGGQAGGGARAYKTTLMLYCCTSLPPSPACLLALT